REHRADVTEVRRPEQGVDHRVQRDVSVRMTGEATGLVRKRETAEPHGNARLEPMCVEPDAAPGAGSWHVDRGKGSFTQDRAQDGQVAVLGQLAICRI